MMGKQIMVDRNIAASRVSAYEAEIVSALVVPSVSDSSTVHH